MSVFAMVMAGVVLGTVCGRYLLPLICSFGVGESSSLRFNVLFATAGSLGAAGGIMGTTWDVVPVWVLFVALVGVTTVDLYHYIVPNAIVFPALGALLAVMTPISLLQGEPGVIGQAGAAAGLYLAIMGVLYVGSRGNLGMGDVKLVMPVGLVLGWVASGYGQSLLAVVLSFSLASVLGLLMGLFVWGLRAWGFEVLPDPMADPANPRPTVFPFAPSLAIAAAVSVLALYATI
ncbi:MAG: prepilin peptidase [bacterium]|nr:prepilin peptidase [bacterium]